MGFRFVSPFSLVSASWWFIVVVLHFSFFLFFLSFFFFFLFTPRLRSHGRFVGCCGHDRGRTRPRLAQTRRRSPWVGPAWGRTGSLIRHAPGPDWSRNCSTGAWNCQTRWLGRSWNGSPRWYDAPAVTSFDKETIKHFWLFPSLKPFLRG